jgi:tartrate dehydrogenase/decarboxylase/D-malate dehydrogenase
MSAYKIAAVPGDGIGVEVIAAGVEVLQALSKKSGFELDFKHFDWNSDNYLKNGYYIPEGGLEELKTFDAIFFGAVGALNVPDHISLWACACRSARASTSTPTCARLACCRG